jgi:hypothetical protein
MKRRGASVFSWERLVEMEVLLVVLVEREGCHTKPRQRGFVKRLNIQIVCLSIIRRLYELVLWRDSLQNGPIARSPVVTGYPQMDILTGFLSQSRKTEGFLRDERRMLWEYEMLQGEQ